MTRLLQPLHQTARIAHAIPSVPRYHLILHSQHDKLKSISCDHLSQSARDDFMEERGAAAFWSRMKVAIIQGGGLP